MSKDYVEVRVHGVAVDPGEGAPIVLLLDAAGEAGIPVPVGAFEASAIIIELEGIAPPRPLTHDLLAELFREGGMSLERAELYGEGAATQLAGSGPLARLVYRRGFRRLSREVRPSDAIALALRLKAPICAERALLGSRAQAEAAIRPFLPGAEPYFLLAAHRA
ncbi:MAG: bifunctional nuclease family protein [Spirochaetaceae bacterium]|nr:bifunctional nuclease family protein [Spirochaetaceae bacterium]